METIVNVRVDKMTKERASKALKAMGMNLTTAVNMLLKQIIIDQKFPFAPNLKKSNLSSKGSGKSITAWDEHLAQTSHNAKAGLRSTKNKSLYSKGKSSI